MDKDRRPPDKSECVELSPLRLYLGHWLLARGGGAGVNLMILLVRRRNGGLESPTGAGVRGWASVQFPAILCSF